MTWFPSRGTRTSVRRGTRRPCLEQLEARRVPAAGLFTYHNDTFSSGQNLGETVLTPADVNSATFGKRFATPVDGQVYAQPLVVPGVTISTGANAGVHDVIFAATEHDSFYAVDAADGTVLWQDNFLDPANGITAVPSDDLGSADLTPEVGITGTPVIDPNTHTLYVVAKTKETNTGGIHYVQRLHALDLGSGAEKLGGPVVVADTAFDGTNYTYVSGPTVNGNGDGSINGLVSFNALRQLQRAALTLVNGTVYVPFGSHGDNGPYHGWVLGFDAQSLALTAAFNDTPNGGGAGIWMAGGKITVDTQGNLYFETGNGTFDGTLDTNGFPAQADYGDSVVKLGVDAASNSTNQNPNGWGLKVVDYFTPSNQAYLDTNDLDMGSSGVLLLPDAAGSAEHPHLLVASGKQGTLYLLDRDNLGRFDPNTDHAVQEVATAVNGTVSTPVYFNQRLYIVAAYGGVATSFDLANGVLSSGPTSQSSDYYSFPGSTPALSANGTTDGIVWDLDHGTNQLRAYDSSTYGTELYTSAQAASDRDQLGSVVKFTVPTVVNGMVYVGTADSLVAYGLLPSSTLAAPDKLSAVGISASQVLVTWHDHSDNEDGFEVQASSDGVNFASASSVGANVTSVTLAGLQPQTTYTFEVRAIRSKGDSAWSAPAQATTLSDAGSTTVPAAPTTLEAQTASGTSVQLTWTDDAGDATAFLIERSLGSDGQFSPAAVVDTGMRSYTDADLDTGTDYFYRVRAVNAAGQSNPSPEADAIPPTPPVTPTGARTVQVTPTEIDLAWLDNSDNEQGFRIWRQANGAGFRTIAVLPTNTASYTDAGLTPDTAYDYHIQAYNVAGHSDFTGVSVRTPASGGGDPSSQGGNTGDAQAPQTLPASSAAKISLDRGRFRVNARTGRLKQKVTLRNEGFTSILGPLTLVLDRLPHGVVLLPSRGFKVTHTRQGPRYELVTVAGLRPGQSVSVTLTFRARGRTSVTYRLRVLEQGAT
jgi:hypothetical protein